MTIIISKLHFLRLLTCLVLVLGILSCNRTSSIDAIQKDTFIKYFGGGRDQKAGKVLQTSDGGYLVIGSSSSYSKGEDYDQFLAKTDINGNLVWYKTFGGKGNDFASDIKASPDGSGFFILGNCSFPFNVPALNNNLSSMFNIRKVGLNGDSLGSYYFGDTTSISTSKAINTGISLALSNNQIFFAGITSYTSTSLGTYNMYLGNCDFSGNFLGQVVNGYVSSNSSNTGICLDNSLSADPYIFTTQNVNRPDKPSGTFVAKTQSSVVKYGNSNNSSPSYAIDNFGTFGNILSPEIQTIRDIKIFNVSGASVPVITGMRNNKPYILIFRTDFNNKISDWFNIELNLSASLAESNAISPTSDGGFIITGYYTNASNSSNGKDIFLAKFNSTGVLDWSKSFGGSGDDEGVDVIQATDGGYLISANIAFGSNNNVIGLIKVKSDGSIK